MEFKIQIFYAWKVMESGLSHGKSWKINQMIAIFFELRTRFRPLYRLPLSTVKLSSAWVNCVVIKYNQTTITCDF